MNLLITWKYLLRLSAKTVGSRGESRDDVSRKNFWNCIKSCFKPSRFQRGLHLLCFDKRILCHRRNFQRLYERQVADILQKLKQKKRRKYLRSYVTAWNCTRQVCDEYVCFEDLSPKYYPLKSSLKTFHFCSKKLEK